MKSITKILMTATAAMMLVPSVQLSGAGKGKGKTAIVAHRGYWNCEEAGYAKNSIAALKCAQEAGFWGSEFDVNMTSDEVLLVYHDSKIDGKKIDQTPYSEFKDVKLKNGENIPTIDDYLVQAKKYPGTVMVYELKKHSTPELENRLVDITIEKLREHRLDSPKKVIFISFSLNICKRLAKLMPEYTVQYLNGDIAPAELRKMGINGIDYQYKVFYKHPEWVDEAKAASMTVNAWTVDEEEDMKKILGLEVDMMTTDNPDDARVLLGKKELKK